ncbi:MAG TPA: GspE/PulE family protein [Candidatus Sumerlaeota bacterium]|nr:MAG: Type II secretion system protein E [candidate division BRC1 bacterium ADurb.BinA292]HPK02222.1 GspE/PulE family protein [Candidatus Sumerlaeota bacterium]
MADPKPNGPRQSNGKKPVAPAGEAADRRPGDGKSLVTTQRGVQKKGTDDEIKKWIKAVQGGKEAATRSRQELVSTDLLQTEGDILDAIAADTGMAKVVLSQVNFTPELIAQVPAEVVRKYNVIPVDYNDREIWLAISDPHNIQALDDLSHVLGRKVHGRVAREDDIERAIRAYYSKDEYRQLYDKLAESDDPGSLDQRYDELELGTEAAAEINQPPVVKYVDLIFKQAVHERASDIHIEPTRVGVTIRFRIDGVLHEVPSPPRKWQNAIISRLKVLSGMDLAEKRVPLDGRIRLNMPEKKLDLRVSSLPTIFGESIVMRLLDQSSVMMGLEDVGFLPSTVKTFKKLIREPNGVILMTGPTGSGKTTTLYAALGVLNTPENKLVTLEDPVEYQIPGINQVQINHEIGLDFAYGLRSLLRQSPDIILVGEIRDLETAENAIRAALTGHLVFSTLHTNDAPSSTIRLIDMGVKPYLVASSLQAAIAQRLVRRICGACKEPYAFDPEVVRDLGYEAELEEGNLELFHGAGCERCSQSGYRGRTAIHEIMVMDSDLRRRVIRSEPASRLKKAAVAKGMLTLRDDGWTKAKLGITTPEEVLRITAAD